MCRPLPQEQFTFTPQQPFSPQRRFVYRLLWQLSQSHQFQSEGFTLIELLVVIVIIGLLAAIALPSFLGQANKARQAEAKAYISTLNRAQQAYYLEKRAFTTTILLLGVGLTSNSGQYSYSSDTIAPTTLVTNKALAQKRTLKSYAGVVYLGTTGTESIAFTIICDADDYSFYAGGSAIGDGTSTAPFCPTGFTREN